MKLSHSLLLVAMFGFSVANAQIKYPATPARPVTDTVHNYLLTDPYRWLEDKTSAETKAWSHAQHDFTMDYLEKNYPDVPGFKDDLRTLHGGDFIGAPFFRDTREFFYARKKGDKQSKLYTRIKGKEIMLFDPEKYDPTGKAAISGISLTKKADKIAIGIQYSGNEIQEYRIIDSKNGKVLGEPISGLNDFAFAKDEKYAYISLRTQEMIDKQIPVTTYLHKIGDKRENDVFLVAPKDAKDVASIWDDDDADLTFLTEGDFYSNTLSIRKVGTTDAFRPIYSSKQFSAEVRHSTKSKMYFLTNDHAPNFKIMVADIANPEYKNWKDFYPEDKNSVLTNFAFTKNKVFITYKKDVMSHLAMYDTLGKFIKNIELPIDGDVAGIGYRKDKDVLLVSIASFQSKTKMYSFDPNTSEWKLIHEEASPLDTRDIVSELVFFTSKDSTRVPMFVIHKKGIKMDGTNPTLLYGYGGFNIPMQVSYLNNSIPFVMRGGVYAIACLRGGNEYGENWHRDGMLFNKQHTFDDCIGAAEYLIAKGYTSNKKLAIRGGSNGGLLVGSVITQRPDLFKAAICAVPLLDMVRYHKFLIARYWIPEYGDPDVEADFMNIIKYSPYQNIKLGYNYPATMVKAGDNDIRVDGLHAKKFVAAIQNNPGQINPFLLYMDFESGHGSGKSIEQTIEGTYLEYKFIMGNLGM